MFCRWNVHHGQNASPERGAVMYKMHLIKKTTVGCLVMTFPLGMIILWSFSKSKWEKKNVYRTSLFFVTVNIRVYWIYIFKVILKMLLCRQINKNENNKYINRACKYVPSKGLFPLRTLLWNWGTYFQNVCRKDCFFRKCDKRNTRTPLCVHLFVSIFRP